MKKALIMLLMTGFASGLMAQKNTLFSDSHISYYTGLSLKTAPLMGQHTPLVEGMGAVVFDHTFAVGGFTNRLAGEIDFVGSDLENPGDADLSLTYDYAGIFLEYTLWPNAPVHLSFPLQVGLGRAKVEQQETDIEVERSRLIVIEPRINLEANLSQRLGLAVHAGYRWADTQDLTNLTDANLSGFNYGILLKFFMEGR